MRAEADSHLTATSFQDVVERSKVSPEPPLLPTEPSQFSQLLHISLMLQTFHSSVAPWMLFNSFISGAARAGHLLAWLPAITPCQKDIQVKRAFQTDGQRWNEGWCQELEIKHMCYNRSRWQVWCHWPVQVTQFLIGFTNKWPWTRQECCLRDRFVLLTGPWPISSEARPPSCPMAHIDAGDRLPWAPRLALQWSEMDCMG